MVAALEGVRVVEMGGGIPAAYCCKLFADLGAVVVKVEPPEGEELRREPPLVKAGGRETSALYCYLNQNKYGVALDLLDDAPLDALLADADLVVHNLSLARTNRLALSHARRSSLNPRLVFTRISGFGSWGPYCNYSSNSFIAANAGGWTSISPGSLEDPSRPPLKAFGNQPDFLAGSVAAVASLGALFAAQAGGLGEDIDISEQEVVASILEGALSQYLYTGRIASRMGMWVSAWLEPLGCKDGAVIITAAHEEQWQRLVEAMGNPEWAGWEVLSTAEGRSENFDVVRGFVLEWMRDMSIAEVLDVLAANRVPAARFQTVPEVFQMEQLEHRQFFTEYRDGATAFRQPGPPYRMSRTPASCRRPAPWPGEHNFMLDADEPWIALEHAKAGTP